MHALESRMGPLPAEHLPCIRDTIVDVVQLLLKNAEEPRRNVAMQNGRGRGEGNCKGKRPAGESRQGSKPAKIEGQTLEQHRRALGDKEICAM